MTLTSGLSIAVGGLSNVNRQLALLAHNVSNASTPGYVREVSVQISVTADGAGMGVQSGPALRDVDTALRDGLWSQVSTMADLETRRTALAGIDALLGAPGAGQDLASLTGQVRDAFSRLATDPSDQSGQRAVVSAAITLTVSIHALSTAYTMQRQTAHDSARSDIDTINRALAEVGSLNDRIIRLKSTGESIADLENLRDAAIRKISELIDLKALPQANGDMLLVTPRGMMLPTRGTADPFSLAESAMQPASWYPGGGVPGIMLGGVDVTAQFVSGRLGANIALRDAILPKNQAALDEFAQILSQRLDAQGLALFTDPAGNVPSGGGSPTQTGYVGYASVIQVNANIAADASLVRDGTHAIAGSPTGASAFIPNPMTGPAGFNQLIQRMLDFAFGTEMQQGVAQSPFNTAGLGPGGTLAIPVIAASVTIIGVAQSLVATQAAESADVTARTEAEKAVQDALQSRYDARTGVNIDAEMATMVQLQNAYGANARVISALQTMWDQLLAAVR